MKTAIVWFMLAVPAAAQSAWFMPNLAVRPPARDTHAMTTEPVSGLVYVFGGVTNDVNQFNDTWTWDGVSWTQRTPSSPPSARESHALAADGNGGVIMFGGTAFQGGGTLNDTWRFAQGQWTRLYPASSPPARRYHAMVSTGQSILLFGGFYGSNTSGNLSDTWEWTGADWVRRFPATVPPACHRNALAFDVGRNRAVMFGGAGNGIPALTDTWEWYGGNWVRVPTSSHPQAGTWIEYHPGISRVVAYGGYSYNGSTWTVSGSCWTYDGTDWTQVAVTQPNPGPRNSPLVWSPLSGGLMTFAGHSSLGNDTWISIPATPPASYTAFGAGCAPAPATSPTLAPLAGETPRIGSTSRLRLSGLPQLAITVFVLGFSDSQNTGPLGAYALPFELSPLGFPGCWQYVSDDSTHFALALNGQVDWQIALPSYTALAGFPFFVQAAVPDAVTSGLSLSNAVAAVIGY